MEINKKILYTHFMSRSEIAKFIKFSTVFLLFSAFIFSIAYSQGSMETIYHFKTQTAQCPVSEAQTGCPTISGHISSLQIFLTTLPDTRIILSVLLMLLAGALLAFKVYPRKQAHDLISIGRLYHTQNLELPLFNHLKLAFAQGILNPKIY